MRRPEHAPKYWNQSRHYGFPIRGCAGFNVSSYDPLTEHEHDEFGDPSDEKSRAHIARFLSHSISTGP